MRSDRSLILAVIFLGAGLGLIIGYCNGTTGFNAAYPFSGSTLHLELTTTGPAVLGGLAALAIGVLFLVWAFLAAIVSLFTGPYNTRERVVERLSVVPRDQVEVDPYAEVSVPEHRRHFWSRRSEGTNI
jgi:hypothetical protein